ncbi:MAG: exodeoxyribonuclease III [Eubacterium sp.]|nr:exodeoxyribonuclease III [Eubacterium sp.]
MGSKRYVSWNVNGIRACWDKGFRDTFQKLDADIFCIQESKMQEGQLKIELPGYHQYWNYAKRKGYSGTAIFTREEPQEVILGMGIEEHDQEGRLITLDMGEYYFITVYVPNSQNELKRLSYRMEWEDDFRNYVTELQNKKPVIICGDMNVAHEEIDLKNPATNHMNPGFTDEERQKMTELLSAGFVDSFRCLYPDRTDAYSWWSYRMKARERNVGWRIDYFLISEAWKDRIKEAAIRPEFFGSDHCPVELVLSF